jgi:hypothetical protein
VGGLAADAKGQECSGAEQKDGVLKKLFHRLFALFIQIDGALLPGIPQVGGV